MKVRRRGKNRPKEVWNYDDVVRRVLYGPDPRVDRRRVLVRKPQLYHRCPNHPASITRCHCRYCNRCCLRFCRDPHAPRAQSACLHCAWCAVCGKRFLFKRLTITGPDLCPACLRGDDDGVEL